MFVSSFSLRGRASEREGRGSKPNKYCITGDCQSASAKINIPKYAFHLGLIRRLIVFFKRVVIKTASGENWWGMGVGWESGVALWGWC